MRRFLLHISITIFMISFLGCSVLSVHPITAPENGVIDSKLQGMWTFNTESSQIYVHVGKTDAHRMNAMLVEHSDEGKIAAQYMTFFTSKVDDDHFLNIQFTEPDGNIKDDGKLFVFLKYNFLAVDTLRISIIDAEFVGEYIEKDTLKGTLPGKVSDQKYTLDNRQIVAGVANYYEITDSSQNIRTFIKDVGVNNIFKQAYILRRMDP